MAVIAAGELHHPGSPRDAPRQAHGAHARFGSAGGQPHQLTSRHPVANDLGQEHLARRRSPVRGASARRPLDSVDDRGMGVAQDGSSVRLDVVDVAPALDVPDVGSLGAIDEVGLAADRLERPHR